MGPKGGPKEGTKERAQRKETKMDHQWVHWWPSMNEFIDGFPLIFIDGCPSMNTDGFPVLWNPVLWKNDEKQWKTMNNHDKPWQIYACNHLPQLGPATRQRSSWGPKERPQRRAQRRAHRRGPKGMGPYSLMDHQWIHWWSIMNIIDGYPLLFIDGPSMNIHGFPVLWNPVLWKNNEKTMRNHKNH